jgi:DNA-binding response OmpR family regulator
VNRARLLIFGAVIAATAVLAVLTRPGPRQTFEVDPERPVYILTVHGQGYRFAG